MDNDAIEELIFKSQHCQRNWDLEKTIPDDDLNTLMVAATQCPSKQNIAFYKLHFITNRDLIERIHLHTNTIVPQLQVYKTNSQVFSNLLIVFEEYLDLSGKSDSKRNSETKEFSKDQISSSDNIIASRRMQRDRAVAIGIAAGYLNLIASMMGYSTGFCNCYEPEDIKREMKIERDPLLLMGIGFSNPMRDRRLHHFEDYMFPTHPKQSIPVKWIM